MIIRVLQILLAAQTVLTVTPSATTTLFQLPANASWLENLAYRSATNTILATRVDVPQLWSISATTGAGTILANVSDITALVGITQTRSSPDEFYVAGLNFTAAGVQPNSSTLWKLSFSKDGGGGGGGDDDYTFAPAFGVPGMTLINGLTTWNETTILATDSYQGNIWAIDLATRSSAPALTDPTMALIDDHGVNGVKVLRTSSSSSSSADEDAQDEAYVYYTSTDQSLLARIPVDPVTVRARAPADVIARGLGAVDDFALLADGAAVIATGSNNTVLHVSRHGNVETVAGSAGSLAVASGTACQYGGQGVLYVTTGGSEAAGRLVAVVSRRGV